jgi:hypothetical protein
VVIIHDAVQADDFPSHLKASDLIAAIFGRDAGFEKTGPDSIERSKFFPVTEQGRSAFDFAARGHDLINTVKFFGVQPHGHAQFTKVAVGAGNFDGLGVHVLYFRIVRGTVGIWVSGSTAECR